MFLVKLPPREHRARSAKVIAVPGTRSEASPSREHRARGAKVLSFPSRSEGRLKGARARCEGDPVRSRSHGRSFPSGTPAHSAKVIRRVPGTGRLKGTPITKVIRCVPGAKRNRLREHRAQCEGNPRVPVTPGNPPQPSVPAGREGSASMALSRRSVAFHKRSSTQAPLPTGHQTGHSGRVGVASVWRCRVKQNNRHITYTSPTSYLTSNRPFGRVGSTSVCYRVKRR